jgi:ERCC4-type nuclease
MNNISVIFDNREGDLIALFKKSFPSIELTVENLKIGDIHILWNDIPHIIIERKTIQDLLASVKDGRYKEQKYRLLEWQKDALSASNRYCKLLYIIENYQSWQKFSQSAKRQIDSKIILGSLCHLTLDQSISPVFTKNMEDTTIFLMEIVTRIIKDPTKYFKENMLEKNYLEVCNGNKPATLDISKKSDKIRPDNIMSLQLMQIPGISNNLAIGIQSHFSNMKKLITFIDDMDELDHKKCVKTLSAIKISDTRKLGVKTAEKIIMFMKTPPTPSTPTPSTPTPSTPTPSTPTPSTPTPSTPTT